MEVETDLFTYAALARQSDPATSHEAARDLTESGARARMQAAALAAVREHPGMTANELEAACGVRFDGTIRKRLAELRKAGLVRVGEARVSSVTGKRGQTWYATEQGEGHGE